MTAAQKVVELVVVELVIVELEVLGKAVEDYIIVERGSELSARKNNRSCIKSGEVSRVGKNNWN